MKKRKLLLSFIGLFALSITGCSFKFVESKSNFSSHFESHIEVSSSSENSESISSQESQSSQQGSQNSSSNSDFSSEKSSSIEKSSSQASSSSQKSSSSSSSSFSSSASSSKPHEHVTLDIFALNDTHGNVTDTEGKGLGLGKTTTALKELSANKNSIFISQGDMWQGSIESNYTRGNLVTEWMNFMDFVSMTIGNHEFDWGQQIIANNVDLAEFPFLGINVLNRSNNKRVDYLQPSTTFTRGGAKIGVIGAIGDCYGSISGSLVKDIYFAWGDYLSQMVKTEATRLRNEEKCDFIIYSVHGAPIEDGDYDSSLSNGYVDLVLEGHSHHNYSRTDEYGVYHIQNYGYNESIYQITVDLDLTAKTHTINQVKDHDFTYYYSQYKNYADDPSVQVLFDKYYDQYSFAYSDLGIVSEFKNANELRNKLSELYYEKGLAKWGSNYSITLGGGYMSCRASGIGPGMVNYADIAQCFPFDNEIVLVSIAGYNFAQTQFITGSSYYFVTWADSSVQWNVDSSATYYLVTDTYTSDFYDNYMTIVDYYDIGHTYARDLLAEYVKAGNWDDTSQNQHAGTISDPMTIADALEQAALYTSSGQSQGYFYKGTVSDFADQWSTSTGDLRNVKVCDSGDTNEMVIFYLKKFSGANLNNGNWTGQYDLVIGDEIIFYGKPFTYHGNYVNILEFASGAYCYSINGVVTGPSY